MENINRGLVAVSTGNGVYVGWRLLGTDPGNIGFNVYRDGDILNGSPITNSTNFLDNGGGSNSTYTVRPVIDGFEQGSSEQVGVWSQQYLTVNLQRPAGGSTPDGSYDYSPNDLSVGDLDGDGQYEIVVKWDPSNAKDNSQSGYTGNVYLDGYELDGTRLWRIDLGRNIRAGAHYTQFIVYDLDGDGQAEVACKTADGTRANNGVVIGNAGADHRNSSGYILSGPEFLTIFDGATGNILATTDYIPARGSVSSWGDNYGNRVDRFLAGVAYLDGTRPSLLMARGYYTRAVIAAWDWRNGSLSNRWTFDSNSSGNSDAAGQGAHSLTIGDVDQDGRDEIVYGAATINDNGTLMYSTNLCHGDALHLTDMNPNRPGLEVYMVHESPSCYGNNGSEMHDARTGQILWGVSGEGVDIGRGVAMDIDPRYAGYEAWASRGGLRSVTGQSISSSRPSQMNFGIWWDDDLLRELLDGTAISKWNYNNSSTSTLLSGSSMASNNGTKANPGLTADIFGDWREEVIWRNSNNSQLRIYTTTAVTGTRIHTLMHDAQYRVAVAWQNVGYNQPPHPGFFLGDGMSATSQPADIYVVGGGSSSSSSSSSSSNSSSSSSSSSSGSGTSVTIQENTLGFCGVDGTVDSNNGGFTGSGFANTDNATGTGIDWSVNVPSSGSYQLEWRFANGAGSRPGNVQVNGANMTTVDFPSTGSWTSWTMVNANVSLSAGWNSISLVATSSGGLANIDSLTVTGNGPQAADCNGDNSSSSSSSS
ncbi:MAG TPA: carbohydrate-binding protein, partial [Gammaproteobacteria bacterium]